MALTSQQTDEWKSLQHVLLQHDEIYMRWLRDPKKDEDWKKDRPDHQIIENYARKSGDKHRGFVTKIIYLESQGFRTPVNMERIDIVSELTGEDRESIVRRVYGMSREPLTQYFRNHIPAQVRQYFNATFVEDYQEGDERYFRLICDLKNLDDETIKDAIFSTVEKQF